VGSVGITTGGPFALSVKDSYVYAGDWQGSSGGGNLNIINVANPAQPSIVGTYVNPAAEVHGLAIRDTRAYLASDTDGLVVVNVSTPAQPTKLFSHSASARYAHAVTIGSFGTGSTPYALVGGIYGTTLDLFDLSDPTKLGAPITYTTTTAGARDIIDVVGANNVGYLLLSDGSTWTALETVDLSKLPQAPTRLGGVALPVSTYGGWGKIRLVGSTIFAATSGSQDNAYVGGLRALNVSNPSAPAIIGSLDVADIGTIPWSGVGLDVVGTRAYLVGKTALHILDVATPTSLRKVATLALPTAYVGDFGGNVVVSGDYAYVVVTTTEATSGGLVVFRIAGL
jgi:hypothetical protein